MGCKDGGFCLTEDIGKLVVVLSHSREVGISSQQSSMKTAAGHGRELEGELHSAFKLACTSIGNSIDQGDLRSPKTRSFRQVGQGG